MSSLSYWSSLNQAQTHQLGCFIMGEEKKKKACDLAILPQFYKASASFADQKNKKLRRENPIFKRPSIFSQPKPMCVWCCILLSVVLSESDLGSRALLTNRGVLPGPHPVRCNQEYLLGIYTTVFSTVFRLQKRRTTFPAFANN